MLVRKVENSVENGLHWNAMQAEQDCHRAMLMPASGCKIEAEMMYNRDGPVGTTVIRN